MSALNTTKFLTDRVAVVTASTKGIGFAIAKRLGLDGASIVVSSRKRQNVEEAVTALRREGVEADGIPAHVGVDEDRKRLADFTIDRYGKLDILVSSAAVNPRFGKLTDITDSEWDKLLKINVTGAFELTKCFAPHLEASGRGNIVFVSSIAGHSPIPSIIRTDFSSALYKDENVHQKTLESIPLGRLGEASEVAGSVAFLVSDDAAYLSGESIGINGGMHARM